MDSKNLIIVGAGGHGRVIREAAVLSGWNVSGFIDDTKPLGYEIDCTPIIGNFYSLSEFISKPNLSFIVALGSQIHRRRIAEGLLATCNVLATVTHPSASVSVGASVGVGTAVLGGSIINVGTTIGRFCIVNTGATIDHDNHLEDGVQIAPGANLAGNVKCERDVFVGTGAIIIPNKTVHANSIVGAGAVVISDVPANCTVVGNPAHIVSRSST